MPEHLHPFRRLGKSRNRANSIPLRKELRFVTRQNLFIFIQCRIVFVKLHPPPPWAKPHLRYLQHNEKYKPDPPGKFFFSSSFFSPSSLALSLCWVTLFPTSHPVHWFPAAVPEAPPVPSGRKGSSRCTHNSPLSEPNQRDTMSPVLPHTETNQSKPNWFHRGEKAPGAQMLNSKAGPCAVFWLLLWENKISLKSDNIYKSGLCYTGLFFSILKMKSVRAYYCSFKKWILQHCWKQEVTWCCTAEFGCASVTWGWDGCQLS